MKVKKSPYTCQVLVCTKCRDKKNKSYSQGDIEEIKKRLKKGVKKNGWKGQVRLSSTGCMGICGDGPNVMLYPQDIWFSRVTIDDIDTILDRVKKELR